MNGTRLLAALSICALSSSACYTGTGDDMGDADAGNDSETGDVEGDGDGDGDGNADGGIKYDVEMPDGGPGGNGDDGCAEIELDTQPVIPTVVLLVDQSGSMDADFAGQQRWDAVYETLMDPDDGVVKPLEDRVSFGLALYTSEDGYEGGECPMLTEVDPAIGNHASIDAVFAPEAPIEDTPTGESLQAVADKLAAMNLEGPAVVVLATDGEPDTCEVPDPQNGQAESLAAAQAAYDLGVETFVISVGNDVSDTHLQEMANAGIGLDPQGQQKADFYKAFDADELLNAFDDIIGAVVPCEYKLDGIVNLDSPCDGTVTLDGQELECGVEWQMADESTLELLGGACQTIKDGGEHQLDATWPCGGVEIP
jgi:hypothetical protein